jgi:hypothetical protein
MPAIGVAVGLYLLKLSADRYAAELQAEDPGAAVCANVFFGAIFLALVGGSLGGIIGGAAVAEIVSFFSRRRRHKRSGKDMAA